MVYNQANVPGLYYSVKDIHETVRTNTTLKCIFSVDSMSLWP